VPVPGRAASPPQWPDKFIVDELVVTYSPLVAHLVTQLMSRLPAHVSRDDLMSAGTLGLAHAAWAFEDGQGEPFASFAAERVRAALSDALPALDRAGHEVRGVGDVRDAVAGLPQHLRVVLEEYFFTGRELPEIAADLAVAQSRVSRWRAQALAQLRTQVRHLDDRHRDSGMRRHCPAVRFRSRPLGRVRSRPPR
jgi:DNA-directed RNA polymerase specialized sigma subunit